MKITYEFDLTKNEGDLSESKIFGQALEMYLFITDIQEYLRDSYKYNNDNLDIKTISIIKDYFYETLQERNISMEI
jgi:hypothetical protein